jgi:DNA-binding response OmpR family regulator
MKILVAEDEPVMLKTIELRLRKDGYIIIGVTNGRDALAMIDLEQPDLIITDIMMPYSSGLEVISKVKSAQYKKTPVIVLSAMGQENVVLEAFNLGADDFITKPFSPNELSVRVKRLLPATHSQVPLPL